MGNEIFVFIKERASAFTWKWTNYVPKMSPKIEELVFLPIKRGTFQHNFVFLPNGQNIKFHTKL